MLKLSKIMMALGGAVIVGIVCAVIGAGIVKGCELVGHGDPKGWILIVFFFAIVIFAIGAGLRMFLEDRK